MCDKWGMPYSVFNMAKELGYIERNDLGICKNNLANVMPMHGRKLYIEHKRYVTEKRKEWLKKKAKLEKLETKTQATKEPKQKPFIQNVKIKQQNTFSILWGLIKFNY